MRNSRGRRGEENDESSGNVKLEEAGEILSGGAGAKVVAREGGRGKKKGSRGRGGVWVEDSCSRAWSRAIPARKSAHLLNSRGV